MEKSIWSQIVSSLAERLSPSFDATNVSRGKLASNRTSTNREWLVQDLLSSVLPISVQVRLGANIIDCLGQASGDVDVVALNPWAAPVWPFAHGVVPVEGVLCAILIERRWNPDVWEQVARTKALVKKLLASPGYYPKRRRTFRPVVGVWHWDRPSKEAAELVKAMLTEGFEQLHARFEASCKTAKERAWCGPERFDGEGREQFRDEFENYQRACGAMLPNWLYFHSEDANKRLLLVKNGGHAVQHGADWQLGPRPTEGTFVGPAAGWPPSRGTIPEISDSHQWDAAGHWTYRVHEGEGALEQLIAEFLTDAVAYGRERPDYRSYVSSQSPPTPAGTPR